MKHNAIQDLGATSIDKLEVYQVGGCVRDALLGITVNDRDYVVVGSNPDEMAGLGFKQVGRDFPVFLHPETHEEYALARQEKKVALGHLGFSVEAGAHVSLIEDLARRDITINAIAMDKAGKLIDPFHGVEDLHKRLLRHVSEAFIEDPLRVLRVARFCAKLNFTIVPETLQLMQQISMSGELKTLSQERIWQEINKALDSAYPENFFNSLHSCMALTQILTEFKILIDNPQVGDLFYQTLRQLNKSKHSAVEQFSLLYFWINFAHQLCDAKTDAKSGFDTHECVAHECVAHKCVAYKWIKSAAVDKNCMQLAILTIEVYAALEMLCSMDFEVILDLIMRIDVLRHKERYQQLCGLIRLIATITANSIISSNLLILEEIIRRFAAINYTDLVSQASDTNENIVFVRAARLQIIHEVFTSNQA